MSTYVARISSNGQVSIPAEVRRRWRAAKALVIDHGDRIVVRPVPDSPLDAVIGKYSGVAPPSEVLRQAARSEEAERDA